MTTNPAYLQRGERARLFPVLADTSREGRTLSIFLATMDLVPAFSAALLADIGQRVGTRSRMENYTEVVFHKQPDKNLRPDGLIVLSSSTKQWSSLVEAKVGNNILHADKIHSYLELAKANDLDALITISNDFAALPTHHPLEISSSALKKIQLFHWSWTYILTKASLLLANGDLESIEQRTILNELRRFLSHPSAGVKRFDQMPAAWTEVVQAIEAGGNISPASQKSREIIGAWHQELNDLSLVMSVQLNRDVSTRISKAHAADPILRQKDDAFQLCNEHCMRAALLVPESCGPMDICADLEKKTFSISMTLKAPEDRKSAKARVNWLLRQIEKAEPEGIFVRMSWFRNGTSLHQLGTLRHDVDGQVADHQEATLTSFDILMVRNLGNRFEKRKNFISEIEMAVPEFYSRLGQYLRTWSPVILKKPISDPVGPVTIEAIRQDAEQVAENQQTEPGEKIYLYPPPYVPENEDELPDTATDETLIT